MVAILVVGVACGVTTIGIQEHPAHYWPIVVSAVLGALLAISELVARYRDDPVAAIFSIPAMVYLTANAAAAAGAYYLILVFGWRFGVSGTGREVMQVLVAGLGSAALFRASLFNVSVGDQIIGVGPSAILNIILTAADRAVDRQRAVIRAQRTRELMDGISFERSAEELLAYCVAAMQNTSPNEAKAIRNRISELQLSSNSVMSDSVKSCILGLDLLTLVGDQVLKQVTDQLREMTHEAPVSESNGQVGAEKQQRETRLLQLLSNAGGNMDLQELRRETGLDLASVALLSSLQQRGVLAIEGEAGRETVRLTDRSDDPNVVGSAAR
jgi:hypothetical protein